MFRFRATLLAAAASAALVSPAIADDDAQAGYMRVSYDQATVVRLDRPAKTVVVGNPLIADAMMISDKIIYVQGRAFGNTNVIALNGDGEEILNTQITVGAPAFAQVTLYRGSLGQQNMACSPRCERTVTMGDKEMEPMYQQSDHKVDVSRKSADLASERK